MVKLVPCDMLHGMAPACHEAVCHDDWAICMAHPSCIKQHATLLQLSVKARVSVMMTHAGMVTAHGLLVHQLHDCM